MIPCTHETGRSAVARPKTGQTPIRHVRLGDEIWEQVERAAAEDESNNTAIVRQALLEYFAKRAKQRRAMRLQDRESPDA